MRALKNPALQRWGRRVDIAAAAGGSLDDQPLGHQVGVFDKC